MYVHIYIRIHRTQRAFPMQKQCLDKTVSYCKCLFRMTSGFELPCSLSLSLHCISKFVHVSLTFRCIHILCLPTVQLGTACFNFSTSLFKFAFSNMFLENNTKQHLSKAVLHLFAPFSSEKGQSLCVRVVRMRLDSVIHLEMKSCSSHHFFSACPHNFCFPLTRLVQHKLQYLTFWNSNYEICNFSSFLFFVRGHQSASLNHKLLIM